MKIPEYVLRKRAIFIIVSYCIIIGISLFAMQRFYFTPKDFYRMKILEDKQYLNNRKNDPKAIANLGKSYFDMAEQRNSQYYYKLSKDEFLKALELVPGEISYEYMIGLIYIKLDEVKEAKDMFQTILRKDPLNVYANMEVAAIQIKNKNYNAAISNLKNALKIEPTSTTLLSQLGYAYEQKGDLKNARINYEMSLKFIPDYADSLSGLKRVTALESRGQNDGK